MESPLAPGHHWGAFAPKAGHSEGVDLEVFPPGNFIAGLMALAVMAAAKPVAVQACGSEGAGPPVVAARRPRKR